MMIEKEKINELSERIASDFSKGTSTSLIPSGEFDSLSDFKSYLVKKLTYLLDNRFERLVNILYMIDVDEKKLSELFSGDNRENIPDKLAELIIERQLQKIELRRKYKSGEF